MTDLSQHLRLVLATTLSVLIILIWDHFFVEPVAEYQQATNNPSIQAVEKAPVKDIVTREKAIAESAQRIQIENGRVKGSINLHGARLDDLMLKNYRVALEETSPKIDLLSPANTKETYFTEFGWLNASKEAIELPTSKTLWKADKSSLNAGETVNLTWTNSQNVMFKISISMDENYMFSVEQTVINNSQSTVSVSTYALITKVHNETENKNVLIHEGAVGVFEDKLHEVEFEKLKSENKVEFGNTTSWLGFSDKYWLTALIPDKKETVSTKFMHFNQDKNDHYQVSFLVMPKEIYKGASQSVNFHLFAGAKEINLLDMYESKLGLTLFDRAVDFGMLYFITKPIFLLLNYLNKVIGNFGISILILTVIIKLLLFPLAHKGFKGMNKLKELQPKMLQLKERYKDDAMEFQRALMAMYKKEKANPMSGCLPILLQIPVFFALYKVLYVSIEMRHAPFFGWIKDLSIPDPTTIFNLFGLIPWDPPQILMIGVFPIMMALTMYIQQRLNPEPADPVQAKVIRLMPVIFLFMFASFPAGLVIYWTWSNILSIAQQMLIKKMSGMPITSKSKKE